MAQEMLKQLNHKRGSLKSQLTLFGKYLEGFEELIDADKVKNLESRLKKIEPLFDVFNDVQNEIELVELDADKNSQDRESYQDVFFELTSKAANIISKYKGTNDVEVNSTNSITSSQVRAANVKLPRLNLPVFDGSFTAWREYSDAFIAMVHNNNNLSNCEKLCYLRSTLKGEPATMLRSLQTTDLNYDIAWENLNSRYNNKRRIVETHVKAILNLETVVKDSHVSLRQLMDNLQNHIQCLKSLDQPTESWDAILLSIILVKLDMETVKGWESKLNEDSRPNDQIPNVKEFLTFLNARQSILESIAVKRSNTEFKNKRQESNIKPVMSRGFTSINISCPFCEGNHFIQTCESFLKLDPSARSEQTKRMNLCLNCLRKGHFTPTCYSTKCRICHKKHNTLLHINFNNSNRGEVVTESAHVKSNVVEIKESENAVGPIQEQQNTSLTTSCSSLETPTEVSHVLLSTAQVRAFNYENKEYRLRVLLDSGSQSNFITEEACKLLRLKTYPANMQITGINQGLTQLTSQVKIKIASTTTDFHVTISCFVIPRITGNLPTVSVKAQALQIPPNIKLADKTFNQSCPIEILIGATLFWPLLCVGQIRDKGITYQKTKLGWIVSGTMNLGNQLKSTALLSLNHLNNELQNFWKIDEFVTKHQFLNSDEQYCETLFKNTTTRDAAGRFIIKLPLKPNIQELGESYEIAQTRLRALENRMKKNERFMNLYKETITDYQYQKHMSKVAITNNKSFHLPHHAVIKESSETTKLRVVFDGSCKPENGISINEAQYVGPVVQDELFSIITRFRTHAYVITGDIAQMYRQIWVHPDHRKYQQILWRDNPNEPVSEFQLNTVTFGMTSAPYIATRCLLELAILNEKDYPLESQIIKRDFYVDDLLTGANSIEELREIKSNLINILQQAGFALRKFKSNVPNCNETAFDKKTFVLEKASKILGISWNSCEDQFSFQITQSKGNNKITKRTILSTTAQLFDPIGLLAPIIVVAKLIIQELWQLKLGWDEAIPQNLHFHWSKYQHDLKNIARLKIPRCVVAPQTVSWEIHGFADASEKAYGACVYIKSVNKNKDVIVNLLAAKSRVAPLKTTSLPTLELLAAVLLAELVAKFKIILQPKYKEEYYWTDSKIVISWLQTQSNKWATFVANRVSQIQDLTNPTDWHHVKSSENPADLISRGTLASNLINLDLWWHGPSWLQCNETVKFDHFEEFSEGDLPERKKTSTALSTEMSPPAIIIENYSNLTKLKRVLAWCLRFKHNCLASKIDRTTGHLSSSELDNALLLLIKISQTQLFNKDYNDLKNNKVLNSKSKILSLNPFLDERKLIRVGGRLKHSEFSFDKRHPILLPNKHYLTKLILQTEHVNLMHAGPTMLLAAIRSRFWPISGRNLARQTAIHLEPVTALSSEAFLAAFRRFVARRGKPSKVYSDNGTNFVGASSDLREFYQSLKTNARSIAAKCIDEGVDWQFIPPHSPHFGGLWEAGVKSTKYHLKRVMINASLTYEELYTVLTQIESILNSRPLTSLTSDPNDLQALTPAHFLIGRQFTNVYDPDLRDIKQNRLSRYQYLQQLNQHFWSRWSSEYVTQLQQRSKWRQPSSNIKIDTMVLLKEDNLSPCHWKMGRIIELHPGSDAVVRVVSVKCDSGVIKRPITKVCMLPIIDNN